MVKILPLSICFFTAVSTLLFRWPSIIAENALTQSKKTLPSISVKYDPFEFCP